MPAQQHQRPATNGGGKPVHTVRHRSIKATIWKNETAKGPMYNVVVLRSYRDDNDEWKESPSIGYDDLMNVAALMYEAHAYISGLRAKERTPRNGASTRSKA